MDPEAVIKMLNHGRAEELACIRLYAQNMKQLQEMGSWFMARLFQEQMGEEVMHARWLGARIRALGGIPTSEPSSWCRKRGARRGATKIRRMVQEAAALEQKELKQYEQGILECALEGDLETKALLEQIVDSEQSHQDQWIGFLAGRD